MMKSAFILFILLPVACVSHGQADIYSALTIPEGLKENANIVVRDEVIRLSVKDKNTARYEVHQVITLLNEQAKSYLGFVEYSDKFRALEDAEISVYDPVGKKKNTWTKKDMNSGKYGDDLVPDGKYTFFNINAPSYPVTIEINYSIKFKGIFTLPGYEMQSPWQSIQHSVFEIEVPSELGIRYKIINSTAKPVIVKEGNRDIYKWEQKDIKAYRMEKRSGSAYAYEPMVLVAPNKFELEDYDGDMTNWKNFGSWINNLYAKTTTLPEDKKQFYRDLVKHASTDREKAAILYGYLQNNMRYVSIQLGIGGLRPFPASFVEEKKYGDCKALSNYLKSALDAVGIRSNLLIIQGSTMPRDVMEDFSANYFNHAILCIPQPKDTIWLECTSTTLPFGELGVWTENRKAMMVTESGGVLVNTPVSRYEDNHQSMNTRIEVNDDGGAKVKAVFTLKGNGRDQLLMYFHDLKEDDKRSFFMRNMEWKQPDQFSLSNSKHKANPYQVFAEMEYDKVYSFNAGSKLFFESRLYAIFDEEIPETAARLNDYYFTSPYQVLDTTVYKFPSGFTPESMPKNRLVEYPFAAYSCNYNWDASANTLSCITVLQIKNRVVKAADYPKLLEFKKQVMANVNEKIVMKKP